MTVPGAPTTPAGHDARTPRRAAPPTQPATLPPLGLDGLEPEFSRLVHVPADDGTHAWHVLDNAAQLDRLGARPVGTVLCVHGNPTWSYLWRDLVRATTEQAAAGRDAWRVIAVDQLGMGFSERTARPRRLARRVRDLGDLTDALEVTGPVVTVGHDWGGVISLGWAMDHPEMLAGLVLLNTAVHQPATSPVPAPLRLALQPGVHRAGTVLTPAFLETTLRLARPGLRPSVAGAYRAPYRTPARRTGIGTFVADIPADAAHPSAPELARIAEGVRDLTVPALVLWGARDPVFRDRYLDDLLGRLPHADLHRFPDAGHLLAEDVAYAPAVLDWLADRRATLLGPTGTGRVRPTPTDAERSSTSTSASASTSTSTSAFTSHSDDAAPRPLWHALDAGADSTETALVEMAPGRGAPPRVVNRRLLARRVRELAAGLSLAGVGHGDRVALLVPPGADLTAALYACLRIGAVVVVADAGLGIAGLSRAVSGARPDHVIGAARGLSAARLLGWPGQRISSDRLPATTARALGVRHNLPDLVALGADLPDGGAAVLPPPPAPADVAAVLFTSGSTGPAKGVVYTHAQLCAVRDALASHYGIDTGTGLVAGFAPFALLGPTLGARTVTPDMDVTSPRTLTARAVADAVAAVDATVLFLSPAALANVVATADALTIAERDGLRRVRTFLSAGAPVPEPLLARAAELFPAAQAHTPYGMTEGLLLTDITLDGIRDADAGAHADGGVCVGRPVATTRVRIDPLDDAGRPTGAPTSAADVTGEIVVAAAHVKERYDRLHLTERASRRATGGPRDPATPPPAPGTANGHAWHRTGDVGRLDAEGRLWVEGRLAHVIVTPAGVVTPVGPEQRIEGVDGVRRAGVVGVGPVGTQQVVAVVEPEAPSTASNQARPLLTRPSPTRRLPRRSTLARPSLAGPDLTAAVRAAVGPGLPLAAVLVVPTLPTDVRHNSKVDRTRLASWAEGILAGGRMRRP